MSSNNKIAKQQKIENQTIEGSQWKITIEDLSEKDIRSMSDNDDVVFYRSSSSCCTTC